MRDLLPDIEIWLKAGERVALATVISTWGSAPRPAGSTMAISERGGLVGSVSGGCVEGAVIQAAQEVIRSQRPQRLHFGVADETAWQVGLACGGQIDIFVQPINKPVFEALLPRIKAEQGSILRTVISGPEDRVGAQELTDEQGRTLAASNGSLLRSLLQGIQSHSVKGAELLSRNEYEIFFNPLPASPTLVMIGGVHIAVALAKIAHTLNFRTVIVDPRKAFGSAERFAHADQLIQAWPQQAFQQVPLTSSTAVASLSHDPKIDDPALKAAMASEAFYVGALGSKKTAEKRRKRLLASGISDAVLARLHAPIGVEINAQTPEEIALAIMAQIIAAYRG
ncbi:MAG: XdhC/CoxI family protein [Anaerolineales bacterium]